MQATNEAPVIQLDQVTKIYGSDVALANVSLEVPRGVVFALLGENGAGKTTAIRILLGLTDADQGRAQVLGLDSRRQNLEIRHRVGCVSERPTMYEWMTVDELGWFTAGFYGDGFLPRFRHLAAQFQLPSNKKIKELSKGMRAKAALALALGHDPELLILDEPTSGLDPLVRREFMESMVDRAASGKTVFLSSHQMNEVERVADIVAILKQGKLLLVERLDRLKEELNEVTVTLANGAPQPPDLAGEILRTRRRARQWQLLTRRVNLDDVAAMRNHESVAEVDVRTPSLEEIFAAYMQPAAATSE